MLNSSPTSGNTTTRTRTPRVAAAEAEALTNSWSAFTASLEGVGTALDKARDAYEDAHKRLCTGNDNIIRVGERLRKTARLQTKRQHAARTLEIAGSDTDSDDRSEAPAALPDSGA